MSETILNDSNFEAEVLQYTAGPVLVDFFAPWCGTCKMMSPIIDQLAEDLKETKIKVVKVNVDESLALAEKYDVMSLPVFIFFKNGVAQETLSGTQNAEALKEKLISLQ